MSGKKAGDRRASHATLSPAPRSIHHDASSRSEQPQPRPAGLAPDPSAMDVDSNAATEGGSERSRSRASPPIKQESIEDDERAADNAMADPESSPVKMEEEEEEEDERGGQQLIAGGRRRLRIKREGADEDGCPARQGRSSRVCEPGGFGAFLFNTPSVSDDYPEGTVLVRVQLEFGTHRRIWGSQHPLGNRGPANHVCDQCAWLSAPGRGNSEVFSLRRYHASYARLLSEVNYLLERALQGTEGLGFEEARVQVNKMLVMWDYGVLGLVRAPGVPAGGGTTEVTEGNWREVVELVGKREGRDVLLLRHV